MQITRTIQIDRPVDEVFAFVAEPANDRAWCRKVESVVQTEGAGPGPGARYAVVHRPVPLRPAREMAFTCLDWSPPHTIRWREDDGTDEILVTYRLEDADGVTRLTQEDLTVRIGAPRVLHPVIRHGISHDVRRQLQTLKRLLEHDNHRS
jgi:uncharacterized protein YndB with AHSA1/START domain